MGTIIGLWAIGSMVIYFGFIAVLAATELDDE